MIGVGRPAVGITVRPGSARARRFAVAAGRLFLDVTPPLRNRGGRVILPRVLDVMEARSAVVLRRLFDDPRFAPVPRGTPRPLAGVAARSPPGCRCRVLSRWRGRRGPGAASAAPGAGAARGHAPPDRPGRAPRPRRAAVAASCLPLMPSSMLPRAARASGCSGWPAAARAACDAGRAADRAAQRCRTT